MTSCISEHPSRTFLDQTLYEHSGGLVSRLGPLNRLLGPGHTAAGFFDYHRNRPHSATVVKDTVAECSRFLSRQRESIICPKRQIIDSASSCVSVRLGIFFEMRTARSGWRNKSCNFTWVCLKKKLAQIENAFGRGLGVLDFSLVGETTR